MTQVMHPEVGELLYDNTGEPCVVVKTWPWEDRVSVLFHGQVMLIELDKLSRDSDISIFINSRTN